MVMNNSFYKSFCLTDSKILEDVIVTIKGLTPQRNITNTTLHQANNASYYHTELFDWFNRCLDELCAEEYISTIKLEITDCWLTKTQKFEKHHRHTHPNSIVSGIFYLDSCEYGTNFYIPNIWAHTTPLLTISKNLTVKETVKPEKGKLILFPSNIEHDTVFNNSTITRYTIAFNTFATGFMGTETTRLKIKSHL